MEKLVIIGNGETAKLAHDYFQSDSNYKVSAFCSELPFITSKTLFGLPIIDIEFLSEHYPPDNYVVFVAISYSKLNRSRKRLYLMLKEQGYSFASYVSSSAFVWDDVKIGENCFIFENTILQRNVKISNNTIIWSGSYIGHSSNIGNHVYISPNVSISGHCSIGDHSFLGISSSLSDEINVPNDVIIGNGTVVIKNNMEPGGVFVGNPARKLQDKTSYEVHNLSKSEILK